MLMTIIFIIFFILMLICSFRFQRVIRAHINSILKNKIKVQMEDNNIKKIKNNKKNKLHNSIESIFKTSKKKTYSEPPIKKSIKNKKNRDNTTNYFESRIYLNLKVLKKEKQKCNNYRKKRDSIDKKMNLKKNIIDDILIYKEKKKRIKLL